MHAGTILQGTNSVDPPKTPSQIGIGPGPKREIDRQGLIMLIVDAIQPRARVAFFGTLQRGHCILMSRPAATHIADEDLI